MRELILTVIDTNNGIKHSSLILKVMERINPQRFSFEQFHTGLNELIQSGELLLLEINLSNRTGTSREVLYFQKGTSFHHIGA